MTSDYDALAAWCAGAFGAAPVAKLFQGGHLSRVAGYRLADGAEVVVKARPAAERVLSCLDLQAFIWSRGFPCPQPLAGPTLLNGDVITAEAYVPQGEPLTGPGAAMKYAEAFARLTSITRDVEPRLSLDPPPPWLGGWKYPSGGVWPVADDLPDDLNAIDTPWLDEAANRVSRVLNTVELPRIVGHADWWPDNVQWRDEELHVVYDWDSLAYLPEAMLAGGASAIYCYAPVPAATIEQSEAFLSAYEACRGASFTSEERRLAWAAGLWNLAFDAKKDVARGGGATLSYLITEVEPRLVLAGA